MLPGKHLDTSSGVDPSFSWPAPPLPPLPTPHHFFLYHLFSSPRQRSLHLFSAPKCFHAHSPVSRPHLLRRAATIIISFNRWVPNVLFHLIDGKTETNTNTSLAHGDTKSKQGLGLDILNLQKQSLSTFLKFSAPSGGPAGSFVTSRDRANSSALSIFPLPRFYQDHCDTLLPSLSAQLSPLQPLASESPLICI